MKINKIIILIILITSCDKVKETNRNNYGFDMFVKKVIYSNVEQKPSKFFVNSKKEKKIKINNKNNDFKSIMLVICDSVAIKYKKEWYNRLDISLLDNNHSIYVKKVNDGFKFLYRQSTFKKRIFSSDNIYISRYRTFILTNEMLRDNNIFEKIPNDDFLTNVFCEYIIDVKEMKKIDGETIYTLYLYRQVLSNSVIIIKLSTLYGLIDMQIE